MLKLSDAKKLFPEFHPYKFGVIISNGSPRGGDRIKNG